MAQVTVTVNGVSRSAVLTWNGAIVPLTNTEEGASPRHSNHRPENLSILPAQAEASNTPKKF